MKSIHALERAATLLRDKFFLRRTDKSAIANAIETFIANFQNNEAMLASARTRLKTAMSLTGRIEIALRELKEIPYGSHRKREEPFAILISPKQAELNTPFGLGKRTKNEDGATVHTYKGLIICVVAGVYGPVVVTEKAYNALMRQAPELLARAL